MSDEVVSKFFVVLTPTRTTSGSGNITGVTMQSATVRRPAGQMPAGALLLEVELAVPSDLFALKAKATLAAQAEISIKSLREIEKKLT